MTFWSLTSFYQITSVRSAKALQCTQKECLRCQQTLSADPAHFITVMKRSWNIYCDGDFHFPKVAIHSMPQRSNLNSMEVVAKRLVLTRASDSLNRWTVFSTDLQVQRVLPDSHYALVAKLGAWDGIGNVVVSVIGMVNVVTDRLTFATALASGGAVVEWLSRWLSTRPTRF